MAEAEMAVDSNLKKVLVIASPTFSFDSGMARFVSNEKTELQTKRPNLFYQVQCALIKRNIGRALYRCKLCRWY